MDRCHLKGEQGDRLHAVLCAAGYNIKWLLRMIAKKGVSFLWHLFLRLQKASSTGWFQSFLAARSSSGRINRHRSSIQPALLAA